MKLSYHLAPHIRSGSSNRTVMGDMIITLGAIYIMAVFYYGQRALVLGAVSVATCVVADIICGLLRGKGINIMDFSAVVTGMIIPLLMPATVSYSIIIAAGLFAICVVKQPFGGVGGNVFNPAAGGFAFAIVCWGKALFAYPSPFMPLPIAGELAVPLYSSTAYTMYVGGIPQTDIGNLLLGLAPGPMGTTNMLVLGACLVYLMLRRTVRFQQPLMMFAAIALSAWLFPRVGTTASASIFYELVAMPTLFFVTFMFTDPVTTPSRGLGKGIYAFVAGLVVMVFRHVGGYEFTEPFALLAMNALSPAVDIAVEKINTAARRSALETKTAEEQPEFAEDEEE